MSKDITIILVSPEKDENIGSICRAMKNFGFSNLILVSPIASITSKAALATAHGAKDIIENTQISDDLDKAINDMNLVIGTTQRQRKASEPYFLVGTIRKSLESYTNNTKIALLFGPESTGLTNEQLSKCDFIYSIPTSQYYPSLNLAQAVMIFIYELSGKSELRNEYNWQPSTKKETARLKESLIQLLDQTDFPAALTAEAFSTLLFRSLKRADLEKRDINAWLKFFQHLKRKTVNAKKILISKCLLGIPCRYDGKSIKNEKSKYFKILVESGAVPVCPEELGNLPTPRPPAEIRGGIGLEVIAGKAVVVNENNGEVTAQYINGAEKTLAIAKQNQVELAIFKSRSPACGSKMIYDGTFSQRTKVGSGVSAALLIKNGIKVINDEDFSPG